MYVHVRLADAQGVGQRVATDCDRRLPDHSEGAHQRQEPQEVRAVLPQVSTPLHHCSPRDVSLLCYDSARIHMIYCVCVFNMSAL